MSRQSSIEWTDHTFNPWWGCTKISTGCANCYAEKTAGRYVPDHVFWGDKARRFPQSDGYWGQPFVWNRAAESAGEQTTVFCGSMCDVFEDRDDLVAPRRRLFHLIQATPWLVWLLLTKRPDRVRVYSGHDGFPNAWPRNACVGVSAENQETARDRLFNIGPLPGPLHFLSYEPAIGPIDLDSVDSTDWVIVGGESGTDARPMDVEWARSVVGYCDEMRIPVFVKQLGTVLAKRHHLKSRKGGNLTEWPTEFADLRVREFPKWPAVPRETERPAP